MAHHKSAIKRIQKSRLQRKRNRHYRSLMRTSIKKVLSLTEKEEAENRLREAVSILDKLASKGIIHRNKAANQKSRLTRYVNRLA
ncbi:MAG: 30S ribosomal protein S20 [Calditrichaeota bacterium]|nr:MAG: 30S ribosomal protein S20 [Calditrichota bacterium]